MFLRGVAVPSEIHAASSLWVAIVSLAHFLHLRSRDRFSPTSGGSLRLAGVLAVVAVLPACATKRDVRDLRDEIREMQTQTQALLRELQESQRDQADSLTVVARGLQDARGDTSRRLMNIEDQLLTIQELTGLSQQQLAGLRDQMERERQQTLAPSGAFGDAGVGVGGGDAQELFQAGVEAFNRGTYSAARLAFQQIVDDFGSDPLAPRARLYLAEILNAEGDLEGAVEAFLQVPEFHPTADEVPEAYLRAGQLEAQLGHDDQAREYLERVVNTWPDSDSASLARADLRDL